MATKKTTDEKSTPKAVSTKTAKTAAKSATIKTMKDAEERAVKAVAKVKKAVAQKASEVKEKVKAAKVSKIVEKAAPKLAKATSKKTAKVEEAEAPKVATAAKATKTVTKAKPKAEKTAVVKKATTRKKAKVQEQVEVDFDAPIKEATKTKKNEEVEIFEQPFDAEYLVLMQKDPNWMHAFWEVSEKRMNEATKGKRKIVLRLFDISGDLTVKRSKKRKFVDIEVPAEARSWYVENTAGNSCVAVLGAVSGKNFMPIVQSQPVMTFDKNAPAPAAEDVFAKASLGGNTLGNFMSSGFTSQTAESWLKNLGENAGFGSSSESMFSGALSSAALQAINNNANVSKDSVNYGKDFFLWVKTRLIVYGGTRPDAHLQVRGEDFPLNPDGTFSFEEDLPDVTKVIPVFATDKDGDFPTTIVPIVVKRTE